MGISPWHRPAGSRVTFRAGSRTDTSRAATAAGDSPIQDFTELEGIAEKPVFALRLISCQLLRAAGTPRSTESATP